MTCISKESNKQERKRAHLKNAQNRTTRLHKRLGVSLQAEQEI